MLNKDILKNILIDYFDINRKDDSYYYILNRDKNAFNTNTMTFEDFQEFDETLIDEIVDYIILKYK